MALLADICTLISNASLGTAGTDLWQTRMPPEDGPDTTTGLTMAVISYWSGPPLRAHDKGRTHDTNRVQISVRAKTPGVAETRAKALYNLLDGRVNFVIGSNRYLSIFAQQGPGIIDRDANERVTYGFNVEVTGDAQNT